MDSYSNKKCLLPFFCSRRLALHSRNFIGRNRQIINYLLTYTNQEKVATHAIAKIATDNLKCCQTLEDIVEVGAKLNWIPSPLPKQLDSVLPNLTLEEQNLLQDIVHNQQPVSKDKLLVRRLIKKGITLFSPSVDWR